MVTYYPIKRNFEIILLGYGHDEYDSFGICDKYYVMRKVSSGRYIKLLSCIFCIFIYIPDLILTFYT